MLSLTTMAVTLAEADAYAASRALTAWTGADAAKQAALRRGQDYIAGTYNARFLDGDDWTDADAPTEVKYAICEAAIRELTVPLCLTPDVVPGAQKVLVAVDGLRWERLPGGTSMVPVLTSVEALLSGLVAGGGTIRLIRA